MQRIKSCWRGLHHPEKLTSALTHRLMGAVAERGRERLSFDCGVRRIFWRRRKAVGPRHRIRLSPDALRQDSVSLRATSSRPGPAAGDAPAAEPVQQRAIAWGLESAGDLERFSALRREPQLTGGETQFAC